MGLVQEQLWAPWSGDQGELELWPSFHSSPWHLGDNTHQAPITTAPGWHQGSSQDRLVWVQPGAPQGCSAASCMGITPQEQEAAASSCGHIVPAPLAGETEESFSCHLLRGPQKWPVPTRHLSPSPAPSPPLSLIKLQVNLPGSGPAPGAKRLPADPDLPPCTSVSMPGTARSPHSSSAHGAPAGPLGGLRAAGSRTQSHTSRGAALAPETRIHQLGDGPGDGGTHRDAAKHPKHPCTLQGQVGKALGLPGATENPASSPAAAAPGQALRYAGTRAWLGLCRASNWGLELGSNSG